MTFGIVGARTPAQPYEDQLMHKHQPSTVPFTQSLRHLSLLLSTVLACLHSFLAWKTSRGLLALNPKQTWRHMETTAHMI